MRVYLTNLGCKLNQAELERLAREFIAAGHRIAPTLREADLHVVNSCTVTHVAARNSRKIARRGRRLNPRLRTVLTGCYVESDPAEAAVLAGVDLVVPNAAKQELVDRVHEAFPEARPSGNGAGFADSPYMPHAFGNSRALVKVEDGCNMQCAFCVIPFTRGRQRSRPLDEVVTEVAALADGGFQEVVVTGVQISAYRHAGSGLYELVSAILDRTPVGRLRLTSIAPWQFDRRLLELLGGGRVCRHFHLSLQSGSDATLERMRRPYTAAQFTGLVEEIRAADPATAITTDWIVGFPGETDREFEESLQLAAALGFARLHVFPYSVREGTEAAKHSDQVPPKVVRARMTRALEVAESSRGAFERERLGETAVALIERRRGSLWLGTTDHYLPVELPVELAAAGDLERQLVPVRLLRRGEGAIEARAESMMGSVFPGAAAASPRTAAIASEGLEAR